MQKPTIGGKKILRLFLKGNEDLTNSLLAVYEGGNFLVQGLRDLVRVKYHNAFQIEITHEPCERSDLLLQQMGMGSYPETLHQLSLNQNRNFPAPLHSCLFDTESDVVVFSLQPEITHSLWKHRQSGFLLYPPPRWEQEWPLSQRQWLLEQCSPTGLLSVQQFKEYFVRLIRAVKERLNAHIIVYNCSSIDPDDNTHNYHNREDTLALRIYKFNLALIELSGLEGISIIDVDRLIAELGGEQHVVKALQYSAEAYEVISHEFLRVLEDIGFFENRPLLMQIGQRGN